MTVRELVELLYEIDPDKEVMIFDSVNQHYTTDFRVHDDPYKNINSMFSSSTKNAIILEE